MVSLVPFSWCLIPSPGGSLSPMSQRVMVWAKLPYCSQFLTDVECSPPSGNEMAAVRPSPRLMCEMSGALYSSVEMSDVVACFLAYDRLYPSI